MNTRVLVYLWFCTIYKEWYVELQEWDRDDMLLQTISFPKSFVHRDNAIEYALDVAYAIGCNLDDNGELVIIERKEG